MRRFGRILVGTLAVVGLLTLTLAGLIIWGLTHLDRAIEPPLPGRMVLALDLDAEFREAASADPLARLRGEKTYVIRDVVQAIDRAATDERVTGLFATLGKTKLSMAGAQELRDAVARFRAGGKPAVVFADTMGEFGGGTVDYYLASSFGQVWLQPSGDVGLTGFKVESPFIKGALDHLGITTEFGARHEYKGAIEIFTRTELSEQHRESLGALLDAWMAQTVDGIAAARRLPAEKVRALAGNGPLLATEALSAGLVDKLGYRDDAWAAAAGNGARPKEVDIADYGHRQDRAKGTRIAVIAGVGAIQRGDDGGAFEDKGFHSENVAKAFREAVDDAEVKAILFRVDSPGGSYVASDTVWHEVRRARAAGKPVVVSMGGAAASGGYFVSMGADRIVAHPGTITGSIGVFAGKFVLKDLWSKLGVRWDGVQRGDNAGIWSVNETFSPEAWERVNAMLDHVYADFTTKAAEGRGLSKEAMDSVARGRVWSGSDAHRLGLVDRLGGWAVAEEEVRGLLKLRPEDHLELVAFPKAKEPWEVVAKALGGGSNAAEMRALARVARVLEPVAERIEAVGGGAATLRLPPLDARP